MVKADKTHAARLKIKTKQNVKCVPENTAPRSDSTRDPTATIKHLIQKRTQIGRLSSFRLRFWNTFNVGTENILVKRRVPPLLVLIR
jgi:hypothetical protein